MKFAASLIVAGIIAGGTMDSPASAHWQFTQGGMTHAEVAKASNGQEEYSFGPYRFFVGYQYSGDSLSQVNLVLERPEGCPVLLHDLKAKYGDPTDVMSLSKGTAILRWNDSAGGNIVQLDAAVEDCTLSYRPLPSGL